MDGRRGNADRRAVAAPFKESNMSKHNKGGSHGKKLSSGSSRQAKTEVPVASNITQPLNYKEALADRQGRNPVTRELKHHHESCVDSNEGDGLWQGMGASGEDWSLPECQDGWWQGTGPSGEDWSQPECQDGKGEKEQANSASHLVEDQASGTQMEHSEQSEHEELPADSVTTAFGMSFLCTCLECQHDNPILKEIVHTHPKKDYYIGLLKQQHAEHEAKNSVISKGLSPCATEFKTPQQKNSDIQAIYDCSSAKTQPSSSFPVLQQRYSDTTTNDEGKMDVCGAEDRRSSSGSQVPADGRDCFEDSQKEDEEEKRGDGVQQGNRRGAVEDDSRERREERYNRGRQDTDNWRRPQDNDRGWNRDDRGRSRGSKKYDNVKYKIVKEVDGDLFTAPKEYSLAHCVATDMRMGSGIAVSFRQTFKRVGELLDQRARVGHIAVLEQDGRFIYYLVTKKYSTDKPLFENLVCALEKMRNHCAEHSVKRLAMPRIGCGLDRLEWRDVKPKIEEVFSDLDISITVYNYNQQEKEEEDHYSKSKKTLFVRHQQYRLVDIESETALIFFGSEDGSVDNCGRGLDCKFNFLLDYKRQTKRIGDVIRLVKKDEVLYGLIVKQRDTDVFSYVNFEKCLYELRKLLRKDNFVYIGIEAFCVNDDKDTMEKVISVMKGVLLAPGLELYVCWPKELVHCRTWSGETR